MNWPLHGSNPNYVYEYMGLPMPKEVIDFSVNLNPFGSPAEVKRKWSSWFAAVDDYPDPTGKELIGHIAEKEQLPMGSVLLGNGAAEIITLLARMFAGKRVLLIQPTFSEYERTCAAYGCSISYMTLTEGTWKLQPDELESELAAADVLFLCHPNNPTGIVYSEDFLVKILKACRKHDCYLVVDEAFYDFLEEPITMVPMINDFPNLAVVRSLTKMYAIAGLRLGYLLAAPKIIEKLQPYQPHWSVNALAMLAGKECLLAEDYVHRTRTFISAERKKMVHSLREQGYLVSDSKVNFYLLRDPDLDDQLPLFLFLLKRGIVARHTANYHGLNGRWLRFAVKQTKENDILMEALTTWKNRD
ncbi:threonine-phosphate decarboxylase CobD [Virgibacillus sp. FSP13]